MNRLIDTMTEAELSSKVQLLEAAGSLCNLKQELERLFAEEPHWSDNLDPKDDQSWVFCFVSDESPEETSMATWIARVTCDGYRSSGGCAWKYATPVNLNVRFKEGDK